MKYVLTPLIVLMLSGQTTPPAKVGRTVTMAWDAPTTNTDGTPLTDLGGYILAIADETADLNGSDQPMASRTLSDPTATESQFVVDVPNGRYSFWVRAYDEVGNASVWEGPVITEVDALGPNPPINVTIRVTIEIGGQ